MAAQLGLWRGSGARGLILTAWGGFRIRGYSIALGLLGMAAGVLAVGVAPGQWLWLGIGGMWLAGHGQSHRQRPHCGADAGLGQARHAGASVHRDGQPRQPGRSARDAVAGPVPMPSAQNWFTIAGALPGAAATDRGQAKPALPRGRTPGGSAAAAEAVPGNRRRAAAARALGREPDRAGSRR
jgi:hypothetical protein